MTDAALNNNCAHCNPIKHSKRTMQFFASFFFSPYTTPLKRLVILYFSRVLISSLVQTFDYPHISLGNSKGGARE